MKNKKISSETGNYTERFQRSSASYQPGKSTSLATGYLDNNSDGIFIEWLGEARIVIRIDGKDYKQTIQEFINNCK
jgi:hypothetical protein